VVERELRLILEAGDDWERRLAGIIGPDRARRLRRNSEANGAPASSATAGTSSAKSPAEARGCASK
jgi:hypothetical protein